MNQVKKQIASEYESQCHKLQIVPNKAVCRQLNNQSEEDTINLVFKGNDKNNFKERMKDKDLIILCQVMEGYKDFIKHVDLSYNEISNAGCEALAKFLTGCPSLESLNLQGNKIDPGGASVLAEALRESYTINYLNLSNNNIQTEGAMVIIELLFQNKSLIELNLGNNWINHDGIIGITSVLNWNNNTLQILNVDNPVYTSVGQETAIHFGKMLQSNRGIEKLSLKKHQFNCEAIYIITEHLLENNKLRVLDLTANKVSFKGCEALAKYLCGEYCVLESLILASNRTGHYGAKAIGQALSKNRTLIHLDMTKNDIDDNGLKMIAESLETNDQLVSLKLYYNNFGQMALQAFHKLRLKEKKGDRFWDFHTYIVDTHIEMAYVDQNIQYDIQVSNANII